MGDSYTAPNRGGKPFVKGDPRINRKGRPKSFDALRALAQQIGHEVAKGEDGQPLVIDEHIATLTEKVMRDWAESDDPRLQVAFIEIAYGKVPTRTEVSGAGGGPVTLQIVERIVDANPPSDG